MDKQFLSSAPFFVVTDLHRSIDYYCDSLGFKRPKIWGDFAMPSRDGFIFMLKQNSEKNDTVTNRDQNGIWDAYVWVEDADVLFAEMQKNGADIHYEPCIQRDYVMKEFAVKDPDGHVIAFGQHYEE